ncbi:hypothetical protein Pcinc_010823 [Petrolisthes cinctipes]|uniref:Uncharacterized protein n=1 Tax=Petrolisthes cinctipes TaxID=88211 RepID=A0AAE1KX26_PETCI|nr:hypothetical protein Pcinc_010823 [Petrolisthes cinctipes]
MSGYAANSTNSSNGHSFFREKTRQDVRQMIDAISERLMIPCPISCHEDPRQFGLSGNIVPRTISAVKEWNDIVTKETIFFKEECKEIEKNCTYDMRMVICGDCSGGGGPVDEVHVFKNPLVDIVSAEGLKRKRSHNEKIADKYSERLMGFDDGVGADDVLFRQRINGDKLLDTAQVAGFFGRNLIDPYKRSIVPRLMHHIIERLGKVSAKKNINGSKLMGPPKKVGRQQKQQQEDNRTLYAVSSSCHHYPVVIKYISDRVGWWNHIKGPVFAKINREKILSSIFSNSEMHFCTSSPKILDDSPRVRDTDLVLSKADKIKNEFSEMSFIPPTNDDDEELPSSPPTTHSYSKIKEDCMDLIKKNPETKSFKPFKEALNLMKDLCIDADK